MNVKKKTIFPALVTGLLSSFVGNVQAQGGIVDYIDGWVVGVSVAQVAMDDADGFFKISPDPDTGDGEVRSFDLNYDDSTAPEIYIAFDFGNIRWQLEYAAHSHDSDSVTVSDDSGFGGSQQEVKTFDASMDIEQFFFSGSYRFRQYDLAGFSPFVSVGFGGADFEVSGESDSSTVGMVQIGVDYAISERIGVEAKLRASKSFHDPKFEFDEGEWRTEYSSRSFHVGANYSF